MRCGGGVLAAGVRQLCSGPGPGLCLFWRPWSWAGWRSQHSSRPSWDKAGTAAGGVFDIRDLRRVLLVLVVLAADVLAWDFVGFLAATLLLLFFLLFRCVEPLRWRTVLIAAVLTLTMTYIRLRRCWARDCRQGAYGLFFT